MNRNGTKPPPARFFNRNAPPFLQASLMENAKNREKLRNARSKRIYRLVTVPVGFAVVGWKSGVLS